MTATVAFAILAVEFLLIAAISAKPPGARLAFWLAVMLLAYPAFADTSALTRSVLALGALWCVVRSADFTLEPAPQRFGFRLIHLLALIDTRLITRGTRYVARSWVATVLLAAIVLVVAYVAVQAADWYQGMARYALRWFAGIVLIVAAFELLTAAFRILAGALGLSAPALSDTPHRSRSIAEFWSARWNLVVGKVLRDRVFTPLARRSTRLAIWATFAVSAAFHAYIMGVAAGTLAAISSAAFFIVQPVLLAAERKLQVRRWSPVARRTWTLGTLALLSPLFLEPVLQVVMPAN